MDEDTEKEDVVVQGKVVGAAPPAEDEKTEDPAVVNVDVV
eukprot:CAMPEP_0167790198 /NCGR_PEP_ID=MMETSP0111_2-20121227/11159_1 /TAXON_ID=91324 /ORGANISM="Lotharella globosa, Strain CCCM811" /LENGTH=39 /DNA_ID= /DNA_START= /DNA_END= /DNA_ORIENTATION=